MMIGAVTVLGLRYDPLIPRWLTVLGVIAFTEQAIETITVFGTDGFTAPGGDMNIVLGAALTAIWLGGLVVRAVGRLGGRPPRPEGGGRPKALCWRSRFHVEGSGSGRRGHRAVWRGERERRNPMEEGPGRRPPRSGRGASAPPGPSSPGALHRHSEGALTSRAAFPVNGLAFGIACWH